MGRISKPPEERRQEIIETAMRHFYTKGYEATSLDDIAKEMNVVKGLCYRYFKSKQELFDVVMDTYVKMIVVPFKKILKNRELSVAMRVDTFLDMAQKNANSGLYHDFFHQTGNEAFHEQLTMKIAKAFIPAFREELQWANEHGEINIDNVDFMADFIMFGQISLWESRDISISDRFTLMKQYIHKLLTIV